MKYAAIKSCVIANGPGVRVSLFVSGCRHHCKDCFNPETWDFAYGQPFDEAVMEHILALMAPDYIRGITYLGASPSSRKTSRGCSRCRGRSGRRTPKNPSGRSPAISSTAIFWPENSARGRRRASCCRISTCWSTGRSSRRSKISISGSAARPISG